jgi:hypothetical protein
MKVSWISLRFYEIIILHQTGSNKNIWGREKNEGKIFRAINQFDSESSRICQRAEKVVVKVDYCRQKFIATLKVFNENREGVKELLDLKFNEKNAFCKLLKIYASKVYQENFVETWIFYETHVRLVTGSHIWKIIKRLNESFWHTKFSTKTKLTHLISVSLFAFQV